MGNGRSTLTNSRDRTYEAPTNVTIPTASEGAKDASEVSFLTSDRFEWPGAYFYPTLSERNGHHTNGHCNNNNTLSPSSSASSSTCTTTTTTTTNSLGLEEAFTKPDAFWFCRKNVNTHLLFSPIAVTFDYKKLSPLSGEENSIEVKKNESSSQHRIPSTLLMTTNPDLLGYPQIAKRLANDVGGEERGVLAFENPMELVVWQLVLERLPLELMAVVSQVCTTFYLMLTPKLQAAVPCLWGKWVAKIQMMKWKDYGKIGAPFIFSPEGGGIVVSPSEWEEVHSKESIEKQEMMSKFEWRGDGWRNGRIMNGVGMVPYGGNYALYELNVCRKTNYLAVTLGSRLLVAVAILRIKNNNTLEGIYCHKIGSERSIDHLRSPGKLVARLGEAIPDSLVDEFEPVVSANRFLNKKFILHNVVAFPGDVSPPVTFKIEFIIDRVDSNAFGGIGYVTSVNSSIRNLTLVHDVLIISLNGVVAISITEKNGERRVFDEHQKECRSVVTCLLHESSDSTKQEQGWSGDFVLKSETLVFQGRLEMVEKE